MVFMKKRRRFTLCYCLLTLAVSIALLLAARLGAGFAEWYAKKVFPLFPHTLGRLFSLLPFSAFELLLALLSVGALLLVLWSIFRLTQGQKARARLAQLWKALAPPLAMAGCTLLLLYMLTLGVNYSRAPLAAALGLEPRPSSAEDLRLLLALLGGEAALETQNIATDARGYFAQQEEPRAAARAAMRRLGEVYEPFDAYYPKPKAAICSRGLSYLQLAGIYSPFTVEANYNKDMPPTDIPFCICHELAHLAGYAREDEANFIAFLACKGSGAADFRYSGLLNALGYVLNALYAEIPAAQYRELYSDLPEQVRRDMQFNAAYWQAFAGPAAQLSRAVNDVYLKANDQPQGVKSYGRMVDLLLAYYGGGGKPEKGK